jgi:uncharacterized protein
VGVVQPLTNRVHGTHLQGEPHGIGMSFIFVDASAGEGPALHRHQYEEVFVVERGTAVFTLAAETVEAKRGDVVVAPPRTPHAFAAGPKGVRMLAIHHSRRFVTEWLDGR